MTPKPKKKTRDERAAEKYADKVCKMIVWKENASTDFLAGVRYGRRTAVDAVKKVRALEKRRIVAANQRGDEKQKSIGVHNFLTTGDAILAIKERSRK